jgi:hypothetical protein
MINRTKKSVAMLSILTALLFGIGLSGQYVSAQEANSPGASELAPGVQVLIDPDLSASNISPGAEEKEIKGKLPGGGCLAASISPGHLFRLEPTTTDTNP